MSKVYSFTFISPTELDAVSPDKVLPPSFRTVQNFQPVPEGSFQRRNGVTSDVIVAATTGQDCQLISPIYLKGNSNLARVAAVTRDQDCTFYSNAGAGGGWTTIFGGGLTHNAEDGVYSVANALGSDNETHLIVTKYSPNEGSCCFAFMDDFTYKTFDATGSVDIITLNWRSAAASAFHDGKMWVVCTSERNFGSSSDATDTGKNVDEAVDLTETVITMEASHGIVADELIWIDSEAMFVVSVATNDLTVIRGVYGTIAATHNTATDVYSNVGTLNTHKNRVRWSKTFLWDATITSWTGAGTGYMDLPCVGSNAAVGACSFKGQLYVLTTSDLFVITGNTSAQYGYTRIMSTPSAIGTTMWASDRYLFWVDANGMHQFTGTEEMNISESHRPVAFKALQVEQYNYFGTALEGSRMPTAFINEKKGLYGVNFPPNEDGAPGGDIWIYNYMTRTFETIVISKPTNVASVSYVSDCHDTGVIWMGTGNLSSAACEGGELSFEPVQVGTNAEKDFEGDAVVGIIETGDINFAALSGGSYDDAVKITHMDLYAIPDAAEDVTVKLDLIIDNTSITQQTLTISADATATQPIRYLVPLASSRTGSFVKVKVTEETALGKTDIRRIDVFYKEQKRAIR